MFVYMVFERCMGGEVSYHLWCSLNERLLGASKVMRQLTYIYIYIHTCMHTYIHTYIRTCIHTCMRTYIHNLSLSLSLSLYVYIYIYVSVCMCVYIYIYIYICIYVFPCSRRRTGSRPSTYTGSSRCRWPTQGLREKL